METPDMETSMATSFSSMATSLSSMATSFSSMATSESEQSLSSLTLPLERPTTPTATKLPMTLTKIAAQYHESLRPPNCATYIMKHVSSDDDESRYMNNNNNAKGGSDDDEEEEERFERTLVFDENFNSSELSEEGEDVVDVGGGDVVAEEDQQHRGVFNNAAKYFKITYTKEEIHSLAEQAEQLVLNTSQLGQREDTSCYASNEDDGDDDNDVVNDDDDDDDDEDEEETTREEVKRDQLSNLSSQKLQRKLQHLNFNQVPSMDISSPDSVKSMEVSHSLESFSEGSRPGALTLRCRESEAALDSLDEVSSGEMRDFDRASGNVSDLWDQESFLSEYHYEEKLDEDNARNLLSFGDDYRKFISSLSSSQSSLCPRKSSVRKFRRRKGSQREMGRRSPRSDSDSPSQVSEICSCLAESSREMNRVEERAGSMGEEEGFIPLQNLPEYNELISVCGNNLRVLVDLLQSIDLQEACVSRRKSREIRLLVSRWNRMRDRLESNLHQAGLFHALQEDILQFRRDLTLLLTSTEASGGSSSSSLQPPHQGLEAKLHTFKEAMVELSTFKSSLFQLNLSVHNLLASVSSSQHAGKVEQTRVLQGEVVQLYTLWDNAHHQMAGCLSHTQDALRKLSAFEEELINLRNVLRQDAASLKERRRLRRKGGGGGKNNGSSSSGDSGISDGYELYEQDLPRREEALNRLKAMAKQLEENLPPNSEALQIISDTLNSTSQELHDLKKIYKVVKVDATCRRSRKNNNNNINAHRRRRQSGGGDSAAAQAATSGNITVTAGAARKLASLAHSRRRRVMKMAVFIHLLLVSVVFLAWLGEPTCCDSYTALSFGPQLRYVNGPPPI